MGNLLGKIFHFQDASELGTMSDTDFSVVAGLNQKAMSSKLHRERTL
jgi:hypothetical protein